MATSTNNIGLVIHGVVDFAGDRLMYPSGVNRDFGYWRSSKRKSIESQFNKFYFPLEGRGVVDGSARVYDLVSSSHHTVQGGVGSWFKAGQLRTRYGDDGIQERSVYLNKGGYVDVGSGIDISNSFSVYAKITPSGDMSSSVIVGQHKTDPALMVLGCNYDGQFYVRSDASIEGENVPYYATTSKAFTDYDYPAQVVGVYSSGDSSLHIYVNGNEEGVSDTFSRDINKPDETRVFIGKREYPVDEGKYTGWIDEVGLCNKAINASGIKDLYDDKFRLSRFVDDKIPPVLPPSTTIPTGDVSKCGCTDLSENLQAEITSITLPEGGTNKGAVGEKITLTYNASATYTDAGTNTYTGVWDSGTVSLTCGGTVRLRMYCGASSRFYMAHSFSWMSDGEDLRTSQTCSLLNVVFPLVGTTSGGGSCCSDDAAAEIGVTVTGLPVTVSTGGVGGGGFGGDFSAVDKNYIEFVVESGNIMSTKGGAYDKTLWGATNNIPASASLTFGDTEFDDVNNGTIALIDSAGTSKTYTIKNDYGATGATEFNAGGSRGAAAANLAQTVESSNGHNGTIHAADSDGVRFTSGGYDFSDGVVVFKQATMGTTGNTTITTAASFDDCTDVNAPATFTGGGDQDNVISSEVSLSLEDPPPNFYQLHNFEIDAWIEHTTNHHSGVLFSAGFVKKSATRENATFENIGWTSSQASLPSGIKQKVTLSGVVPNNLMHLDGRRSFKADFKEHELKFFLHYPRSEEPYDAEFKIYSTKLRHKSFDETAPVASSLDLFTEGSILTTSSGTMNLIAKSDPVVRTLPLFLRSKDGLTGLGNTGNAVITASPTITTSKAMDLFVTGGVETASMNLFIKNIQAVYGSDTTLKLLMEGGLNVLPSKFNFTTLFIKDVVSGSGIIGEEMILAMPKVGNAFVEDRRLLFTRGAMPHTVKDIELFLKVNEFDSNTTTLFLEGPIVYSPSSVMNMFMKVHKPVFPTTNIMSSVGTIVPPAATLGLFASGHAVANNNINLSMLNTHGIDTNTTSMYTTGYDPI